MPDRKLRAHTAAPHRRPNSSATVISAVVRRCRGPTGSLAVFVLAASLSGGAIAQNPVALDDEIIFVAVEQALHRVRPLALANIMVRSQDGFVTLSGSANTMEDVATAGMVAARVRGVTGVRNEIRIVKRPRHG